MLTRLAISSMVTPRRRATSSSLASSARCRPTTPCTMLTSVRINEYSLQILTFLCSISILLLRFIFLSFPHSLSLSLSFFFKSLSLSPSLLCKTLIFLLRNYLGKLVCKTKFYKKKYAMRFLKDHLGPDFSLFMKLIAKTLF